MLALQLQARNVREVGLDAGWRQDRCGHYEMLLRIMASGANISTICSIPWIRTSIFKVDWLHAVDQGVAADVAGNLLMQLIRANKLFGRNQKARCNSLWHRLQTWYTNHDVGDILQNLALGVLCKNRRVSQTEMLCCSDASLGAVVVGLINRPPGRRWPLRRWR